MREKTYEITEKGIGLGEWEFILLCNACSISDVVCFEQHEKTPGEEEALQTILEMVKRNLLVHNGEAFRLSDDMLAIMKVIATRKHTVMLRSPEREVPDCCLYISEEENLVLAEPGAREGEYIVLKMFPKTILRVFLENGDYIPNSKIPGEVQEIRRKIEKTDEYGVEFTVYEEAELSDYRFKADFYTGTEEMKTSTLYVYWDKGNELMLEITGTDKKADYYSEDRLLETILLLAGLT